ncbi:protamine-like [Sitophilus oryzae]|uniref:Protamine-like n=1 Tax=Sitophilus oryzae TaxID=7048 RepID=A0A6J2XR33_SITOR|nr:protamine-like [Sitophilus oryzae]
MTKQRASSKAKNVDSTVKIKRDGKGISRTGRITNNPFLNFLREMRKKTMGLSPTELSSKGAEIWRNMTKSEKEPYCLLARQARRRRKSRRRRRRRGRGRSRTRSVSSDSQADSFVEARRGRKRSRRRRGRSRRRRR